VAPVAFVIVDIHSRGYLRGLSADWIAPGGGWGPRLRQQSQPDLWPL